MTARKHHYVPQCYLKGFSITRGKTRQVIVFDRVSKRAFPASIADVAAERDFNTVDLEGQAPDAFELGMAAFESELAPALERIITSRSLKNEEDRIYLMNLIGNVAIRNPSQRENMRDFHERIAKAIMNVATATPERWASQVKKATAAGYIRPELDTDYEKMKSFLERGEYTIEVPNERHIVNEMSSLDAILPYLVNRKWVLIKAPADSGGFVTSDQPVCLIWSDPTRQPAGFGLRGTEVIFPISNRLAAIGAFELDEAERDASERFVAEINGLIIAYSRRQVYARDQHFTYVSRQGQQPRKAARLISDANFLKAAE
jgi:hypothetical protein